MRNQDATGDGMMASIAAGGVIVDAGGDPAGIRPRDARDVADAVAAAAANGERLRMRAGGSWLRAGRPTITDRALDLSALTGIIEYVPGDLTLTAHAATPLDTIAAATHAHNQWLPLDAFGDARGTLGATLATASAGPLASSIGLPRDLALGLGVVTGRGEEIRAGGRVVKNVAGYDLVRLQVGAWGTLGVITEVTVRLRGRPDSDLSLALPLPSSGPDVAALLTTLRQTTYATLAAELLSPAVAAAIGVGATACMLVRVAGNQTQVAAQRAAFAAIGDCIELDSATVWPRLRTSEPAGTAVFRVSAPPSVLAATWEEVATNDTAWCHASLERGIVRCVSGEHEDDLTQRIRRLATTRRVIIESAPEALWNARGGAPPASLDDGMRRAFDPGGVLNPGILGGSR